MTLTVDCRVATLTIHFTTHLLSEEERTQFVEDLDLLVTTVGAEILKGENKAGTMHIHIPMETRG